MGRFKLNHKNYGDGLELLHEQYLESVDAIFCDFQYRGIMDKMDYGNEGSRQKGRALLKQMDEKMIIEFIKACYLILKPSSYYFLWVDKFILCQGSHINWMMDSSVIFENLHLVDMITWDKASFGMGYRTRKTSEYLLIYQKSPKLTRSWKNKSIKDVWCEKIEHPRLGHPHKKPIGLTKTLIECVTNEGDLILDPCAGSFSVLDACLQSNRNFI